MTSSQKYIDRFWSRVDKSGDCWVWTSTKTYNGYGHYWAVLGGQKHYRAHRFSWAIKYGSIPGGLYVCHSCDNPACVNPDHLWLGNHQQNADDCKRKGRYHPGERSGSAKLTEDDVRAIRASSEPHAVLAREYGIHGTNIARIRSGEKWAHVK